MTAVIAVICLIGIATDILFIKSEYDEDMKKAVWLKGFASVFFVILGIYCFSKNPSSSGKLIVIGLALGMIGDVLLIPEGNKWFTAGGISFMVSHFFFVLSYLKDVDFRVVLTDCGDIRSRDTSSHETDNSAFKRS